MKKPVKKIKNLKIDSEIHNQLKKYCDKNGLKIYKFLEKLIMENCKETKAQIFSSRFFDCSFIFTLQFHHQSHWSISYNH